MKKGFIMLVWLLGMSWVHGQTFAVLDCCSPTALKNVTATTTGFNFAIATDPDGAKILKITAEMSDDSSIITHRAWHGFNINLAGELPAGKLQFDYRPETRRELWINVVGSGRNGKAMTLDFPLNMYGSNLAPAKKWTRIILDLNKGHVSGKAPTMFGALTKVSRVEFRLHPNVYKQPGKFEWAMKNLLIEAEE